MIESIRWPNDLTIYDLQGMLGEQISSIKPLPTAPKRRDSTCVLELIGSSTSFIAWAATQNFADITIGPPSLEMLFRPYYQPQEDAV